MLAEYIRLAEVLLHYSALTPLKHRAAAKLEQPYVYQILSWP